MIDDYEHPKRVSKDERPEKTVENIPSEIVRVALQQGTTYRECPECGERQWMGIAPGHNSYHDCINCGTELVVV
ncbi:hypothetical protein [Natrinema thermotolerans]|uniref:hypothetical protein n=1 Tax=Natrinema thermotolerans TaxID=121872 RepID=UPI0006791E9E|nr:hypothetical protein [Natrinema thermotolerans]QCC57385.1 hypothetical protein DVR14_01505 [Natrinema thermotolerans]